MVPALVTADQLMTTSRARMLFVVVVQATVSLMIEL
jgi:hypothetical protein